MMLFDSLGLINKTVKVGPNSGYDPEMIIELGFEMWAGMRYLFFSNYRTIREIQDPIKDLTFEVGRYSLYTAPGCSNKLRHAAKERFSKMYIGCIH